MRRRPNHLYILLLSAAVLFHPEAARAQASSDSMPTTMEECEPGGCGTWVFNGKQGTGRWTAGPVGDLTIERFDAGAVSIRRVDTSGPGKGLSGLYSGTRKADQIEGTFTWIWPGGPIPAGTVNWYATIQREAHEPAHAIPVSLSMCEESDGCSTWSFQGKEGHGQWSNGASANLLAEHFGDRAVSIRRVDTTGSRQGLTAFYSGARKGDHIEGTLIWSWQHNGQYAAGTTSWHATIGPATPEIKPAVASESPGNAIAKVSPPKVETPPNPAESSEHYPTPPKSAEGYPPPPVGTPSALNGRMAAYDLNGVWEGYYATPALPTAIRIHHDGYHVSAELLHDDFSPTGQAFFRGDFDPKTFTAKIEVAGYGLLSALTGSQPGSWSQDTLGVADPDHVQVGNRPAFQRMTIPGANDIPCESGNHFQVQAEWAGMRGKQAGKTPSWHFSGHLRALRTGTNTAHSPLRFCTSMATVRRQTQIGPSIGTPAEKSCTRKNRRTLPPIKHKSNGNAKACWS
jgi:hypothetical protein